LAARRSLDPDSPDGWSARQIFNGELPGRGIKKVAVVSPAFASDCLETLEEINVGNREMFEHAGGERFTYIPCLNDHDDHIAFLEGLALNELQGWL
jgi:ferrochelatase